MNISRVFEFFPLLEVMAKNLYGRNALLQRRVKGKAKLRSMGTGSSDHTSSANTASTILEQALYAWGVGEGDILIVHSSVDICATLDMSPTEAINFFRRMVGVTGTVAMPAIPIIKGEPAGVERLDDGRYAHEFIYNVNASPPWTGLLPRKLMQTEGSVRSMHPLNTMVALGPHAKDMMAENLAEEPSKPCGPGSAWDYCHRHGAKIVALNCDLAHSLTMIHLVEDMAGNDWCIPVNRWYRERRFQVIAGTAIRHVKVLERRAEWGMWFAERRLSRLLFRFGIAKKVQAAGLQLSFCSSRDLISFARSRPECGFPYHIPLLRLFNWFRR